MRSRLHYWRRCLWDFVRYNRLCGWLASKALAGLARVRRRPLDRLSLLARAARVCPGPGRLAQLRPAIDAELARVDSLLERRELFGDRPARTDLPKGILLKAPV